MKPKQPAMITKTMSVLTAFLLAGFVPTTANSVDKPAAESNEAHHPDAAATVQKTDKMDMGKMHEMMQECMSMHKDGRMCDHEMMENCGKQMGKGECKKMMKETKAQVKKDSKKK